MEHIIIGLIVGIVMGLTGAGGALISIPLFIYMLNATLKEATVLSLIAVIFGTCINLFDQKHKPDLKVVIPFVFFGTVANYSTLTLKTLISDIVIAGLLITVGAYSVWSVWKPTDKKADPIVKPSFIKSAAVGIGLGVMTTLTGLGGGVLLIPILKNFYGKNYDESLPSSLLTILFISSIAFLLQINVGLKLIDLMELAKIGLGTVGSYFLLRWTLKSMSSVKVNLLRKLVFTAVAIYSITSVVIRSL